MADAQPPAFQAIIDDAPGWEILAADLQYANPYVQVYLEKMRTPCRPNGLQWTVVRRKAAVIVAPMTTDGRLLLIRQERVPIRAAIWEFPAGQIDNPQADAAAIRATAVRELREETGYELEPGGQWIALGRYFSSPGFTDEQGHIFLARGVRPGAGGPQPDENESIHECRAFAPEELRRMIAENEIRDANTLSAFARMCARGFI